MVELGEVGGRSAAALLPSLLRTEGGEGELRVKEDPPLLEDGPGPGYGQRGFPARGPVGCPSSRGPWVASPSCTGPFIHPRPDTQHRGSKPAGDGWPFLRWQGPSTAGFTQPESWEAGGRPGSRHENRSHLGVDSGPLPWGTRGRDAPHQTRWAQAAPGELQVHLPGGLFCSRPGGSKRESICFQHGRGSSGVPEGGVPGPLLPAVGPGKPSEGLTRPLSQMSSGMSQLIGLKEKGLPHIARLLQSGNSDVVRSGASLLSNMSRHPALHRVMGERPRGRGPTLQSLLGVPL